MSIVFNSAIDQATVLMAQRISYSGSNAQYIGFAPAGSKDGDDVWIIQRLEYDSSDLMLNRKFAGGSIAFDKKWTKRTEYSYA